MADVVIRRGTVVDGTGRTPPAVADVAVTGGRITAVGPRLDDRGDREIDAEGHLVTPGFVDVHTHYDAQVFWDGALTPSPLHGVTTALAGNCGFTIAPLSDDDAAAAAQILADWEDDREYLLDLVGEAADPDLALASLDRLDEVVDGLMERLSGSHDLARHLIGVLGNSESLGRHLLAHPEHLDWLDGSVEPLAPAALRAELLRSVAGWLVNDKRVERRSGAERGSRSLRSSPSVAGSGWRTAPASGCGPSTPTRSGLTTSSRTARTMDQSTACSTASTRSPTSA